MDRTTVMAEVDFLTVAVALASCDDREQAAFLNTFAQALYRECGGEYRLVSQCGYIADHLDPRAKIVVTTLAETIKTQKEGM